MPVHPDMRYSRLGLLFRKTEKPRDNGRRGELDKNDMVKPVGIEGVFQEETTLDFVRFDNGRE